MTDKEKIEIDEALSKLDKTCSITDKLSCIYLLMDFLLPVNDPPQPYLISDDYIIVSIAFGDTHIRLIKPDPMFDKTVICYEISPDKMLIQVQYYSIYDKYQKISYILECIGKYFDNLLEVDLCKSILSLSCDMGYELKSISKKLIKFVDSNVDGSNPNLSSSILKFKLDIDESDNKKINYEEACRTYLEKFDLFNEIYVKILDDGTIGIAATISYPHKIL